MSGLGEIAGRVGNAARSIGTLVQAGVIGPVRPDKTLRSVKALRQFGPTTAAALETWAARDGDRPCVVDEQGAHSYRELNDRGRRVAAALGRRGLTASDSVGLLCRNHAQFIVAMAAITRIGARTVLMNTGFAGPQLRDVSEREGCRFLILDDEFTGLCSEIDQSVLRILAVGESHQDGALSLDGLAAEALGEEPAVPSEPGRTVVLTSGTTGTPKGANRAKPPSVFEAATLIEAIPYRSGDVVHISAPMFHSWGLANLGIALALGETVVCRRKFDPASVIADINRFNVNSLVVVPVMLSRILELPDEERRVASGSLKIIALSGSALPGDLAQRGLDEFGPVLYNLYGSTEVAWATIAGPEDLRAAPGTAGRPPRGTVLRLFDEEDRPVGDGERGRIFVGNDMLFEGYTGGGTKPIADGLMATGDVGWIDPEGRLFVEGRDDDMIVSGGENVFPEEVENCLLDHPAVREVAVVGVKDEQFGQRLRACVVCEPGSPVAEAELLDHVKANLARYKVPREVVFIDELPRNETGKVLRRTLGG